MSEARCDEIPLLPTGSRVNVAKGEGEYVSEDLTYHIIDDDGRLRAVSGYGGAAWAIDEVIHAVHDQSHRSLTGDRGAIVVGIRHNDGRSEGDVPDVSMPHWVMK